MLHFLKLYWNFRAILRLCYQHLKWNQCRAHQVCIYKYAWNQIIPTWIEFIQSWNEFIPSISNSLPGFNKNKSRAALGAFIRKILFGTSSIYYFWFLEKFLIFTSAKLQFIQEWIHSRMESIHTNYEPNHSNYEWIHGHTGFPILSFKKIWLIHIGLATLK